jgi:hypothetical protein
MFGRACIGSALTIPRDAAVTSSGQVPRWVPVKG